MAQRITRFSVGQTSKVLGVMYTLTGLLLVPFFLLAAVLAPEAQSLGIVFALALPVLYGVLGYLFTALGCAVYNMIAGWVGGIEVELDES